MNFLQKLREMHAMSAAVKEALDNLPSAVCYFTPDGSVKLCNAAMYRVYRRLAQSDLQQYTELKAALEGCGRDTGVIRDGNVFLFPDGRALQYAETQIRTEEGRQYTEAVFSDVTELYERRRELERQSREMKKMYAGLKALSGQLLEVTREQEILNAKNRLHDQMNMGITAIRQVLRQNVTSEENAAAIARFRRSIAVLREDAAAPQDDLSEFLRDAQVAGVRVTLQGELPREGEPLRLAVAVLREACVNAARHADASALNVAAERTENAVVLRITNDGRPPEGEVIPRGGLRELKRQLEQAGGSLCVCSQPAFVLTVTLPGGGEEKREEAMP